MTRWASQLVIEKNCDQVRQISEDSLSRQVTVLIALRAAIAFWRKFVSWYTLELHKSLGRD